MPWKRPGDADSGRDRQSNNVNFGMNGFNLGKYFNGAKTSFFLILLAVFAVWFISGFYTVKESDRGVVLRFGKFVRIVEPGLNWKPTFIDKVYNVNITAVQSFTSTGLMLTQDENVVKVEMNVQFRISDAKKYLFSVTNPQESLKQASDSALRFVVGHTTMDDVLTKGRQKVKQDTWEELQKIINPYDMGLTIVDVNMLPARAPDQVKDAFDDAIAAQEDEQRYIREAEAYAREVRPKAVGRVQRLNEEAEAYRQKVVLAAEGEVARFKAILPEYNNAPTLTKKRIYLETMEEIYSKNNKVILDVPNGGNSMIYLPIDKMINNESATANKK
ncbi:MAG: FtsH protease activity modulator HflK [Succinivibrionaceae bacterium]|jgi:membrane protease subunit HflK|nr:FtsH protease activity modulator HflK [Succinivibrionaceae bacterium]